MLELWDQEELTSFTHSHKLAHNSHKVVSAQLEHLWCQDEPWVTRTHKTHHGLDLGETTTFPLIVYSAPLYEPHIQMTFLSRDSRVGVPSGSPEIALNGTPVTLEPHNFASRLWIEVQSKAKLQLSSRAFQQYVAHRVNQVDSRIFLVGSQTDNLTSDPSCGHNLCFRCPNEQ